ncbi:MAG: glycosyltransferase family 2 protein [Bacilli bacterium]|nr:glycosyltransferase family 2 protein [Bacilli bacterium]
MRVLIIIPAYNEEENILNTVKKIEKCNKKSKYDIDYIIINDGSTDNTLKVCKENNLNVITLINNLGIGGAVQTGYLYASNNNYDVAIQFDGDGQHDERYIDKLVKEIENGYDFVIGSRFIEELSKFKSTKIRRLGIRMLSFSIKLFTKKKIYDPTSGFRAANKKVIELFKYDYPQEYPEPESTVNLIRKGFKIKEIPVEMHEREFGESSIKPLKSIYYMFSVLISIFVTSIVREGRK